MVPQEEKYISITVTLPEEYVKFLDEQMSKKDMNRSQVVRAAIRELQAKQDKESEGE